MLDLAFKILLSIALTSISAIVHGLCMWGIWK